MKVIYSRKNNLVCKIIRWVTWSDWSHVGIIDNDFVIEAVMPRVRVMLLEDVLKDHPDHHIEEYQLPNENEALRAAYSQVGKPYDWRGVLGLWFRKPWMHEGQWWCSEFVAWCAAQGGRAFFRTKTLKRVTPQHLWMIAV